MEDDGPHPGHISAALGGLWVKVAQLGDALPLRAGLGPLSVRHQLLLSAPAMGINNKYRNK